MGFTGTFNGKEYSKTRGRVWLGSERHVVAFSVRVMDFRVRVEG